MATDVTRSVPGALPIGRIRRVVDIDQVDDIAGFVRVNGREITVHHLDALAYDSLRAMQEHPESADYRTLYDAAARACPELALDEIDRLSGPKIGMILSVAEQGIKEIEAALEAASPNAVGSTETTETIPATPASPPA